MLLSGTALRASGRVLKCSGPRHASLVQHRCFSSAPKKPSSSQFVWQVGTAAALVGTYMGVNYLMSTISKEEDDYDEDGPGKTYPTRDKYALILQASYLPLFWIFFGSPTAGRNHFQSLF